MPRDVLHKIPLSRFRKSWTRRGGAGAWHQLNQRDRTACGIIANERTEDKRKINELERTQ